MLSCWHENPIECSFLNNIFCLPTYQKLIFKNLERGAVLLRMYIKHHDTTVDHVGILVLLENI